MYLYVCTIYRNDSASEVTQACLLWGYSSGVECSLRMRNVWGSNPHTSTTSFFALLSDKIERAIGCNDFRFDGLLLIMVVFRHGLFRLGLMGHFMCGE